MKLTKDRDVMLEGATNALYQLTDCLMNLQAGKERDGMTVNRVNLGICLCGAKIKRLLREEKEVATKEQRVTKRNKLNKLNSQG
jgi:hypothetical protein